MIALANPAAGQTAGNSAEAHIEPEPQTGQPDTLMIDSAYLVLSSESIHRIGAVRPGALLQNILGMSTWSNDRVSQRLLGMGLGGLHTAGPAVVIDGMLYDIDLWDRAQLEQLPITSYAVSKLTFDPAQAIMPNGRLADGVISIETKHREGLRWSGSIAMINETGDPGPDKHRDSTRTNVDRSGPATDAEVSWTGAGWHVASGLRTDLFHLTDERLEGRVRRVYSPVVQPVVTQFSPYGRLRRTKGRFRFDTAGGWSRRKDLDFHELAGWEWPHRSESIWGTSMAHMDLSPRLTWRATASYRTTQTSNRAAFIELPRDLELGSAFASTGLTARSGSTTFDVAAGIRQESFTQEQEVGGRWQIDNQRAWIQSSVGRSAGQSSWSIGIMMALPTTYSSNGPSPLETTPTTDPVHTVDQPDQTGLNRSVWIQAARHSTRLAEKPWTVRMRARWSESGRASLSSMIGMMEAGFDPANWINRPFTRKPTGDATSTELLLEGRRKLTTHIEAWFAAHLRRSLGETMWDRRINQPFGLGPMLVEATLSGHHKGWVFSRALGATRISGNRRSSLLYQFYHVSSEGDDVFFRSFTGYPRHMVQAMISGEQQAGLTWFIRAYGHSAWTWPEYIEPARRTAKANVQIDATIGKRFAGGTLWGYLSFLNALDRPIGIHPAGVEEQLAVRLTLRLGTQLVRTTQ